jgi:hypothetical protein
MPEERKRPYGRRHKKTVSRYCIAPNIRRSTNPSRVVECCENPRPVMSPGARGAVRGAPYRRFRHSLICQTELHHGTGRVSRLASHHCRRALWPGVWYPSPKSTPHLVPLLYRLGMPGALENFTLPMSSSLQRFVINLSRINPIGLLLIRL